MNRPLDSKTAALLRSLGEDTPTTPVEVEENRDNNVHLPGQTSSTEERAIVLLGAGVPAENVASALGVNPSRIAQLLSDENFAEKVTVLRFQNLQKHNARDSAYDDLEDELVNKLKRSLPLMIKPETILKAIAVVNGAKRRGQASPDQVTNQQNIVNLTLPQTMINKFTVNVNNQVVKAGEQELLTMPSSELLNKVKPEENNIKEATLIEHNTNEQENYNDCQEETRRES